MTATREDPPIDTQQGSPIRRRILITGSGGQLGRALVRTYSAEADLILLDRSATPLDDWSAVRDAVRTATPDVVIHAAAETDVDRCEREPEHAWRSIALATRNVARAAAAVDAGVIHISTNYVFDGGGDAAWHEWSPTGPISVYGATKLAAEDEVRQATARHQIIRTAWLYANDGRNFLTTMRRLISERDALSVVADQTGNPTFVADLAEAIHTIHLRAPFGTYHVVNSGVATWFEWADAIRDELGGGAALSPIAGADWKRDAQPPTNGAMTSLTLPSLGITLPDWRDALLRCMREGTTA